MQLEEEENGKRWLEWLSNLFLRIVTFRPTLTFPHLRFSRDVFLIYEISNLLAFKIGDDCDEHGKTPIRSEGKVRVQDETNVSNWNIVEIFSQVGYSN